MDASFIYLYLVHTHPGTIKIILIVQKAACICLSPETKNQLGHSKRLVSQ